MTDKKLSTDDISRLIALLTVKNCELTLKKGKTRHEKTILGYEELIKKNEELVNKLIAIA